MSPTCVPGTCLMPHHDRPKDIDGHPHWIVRSADGAKLATLYRSEATGYGADFSAEVGGTLTCRGVPSSPCLPMTAPDAVPPLTWAEVAAEVGAMLAADGWVVCWPVPDTDTGVPVWGDEESAFFDAVWDHSYTEGRAEAVRAAEAERDAAEAERDRLRAVIAEAAAELPLHPAGKHLTPPEADAERVRLALLAALRGAA